LEGAGVPEHASFFVDESGTDVEEVLSDVGRPAGVAGAQDCRGIIAWLGT
jgi:hypothetical protein